MVLPSLGRFGSHLAKQSEGVSDDDITTDTGPPRRRKPRFLVARGGGFPYSRDSEVGDEADQQTAPDRYGDCTGLVR